MASIRRKPGTRYLIACYTDALGEQRQRSTKSTDRKFALKFAEDIERAYRFRQTEFQLRRILSDAHEELHGRPLEQVTARSYFATWLKTKEGEIVGVTLKSYKKTVGDFIKFIGELADHPFLNIGRADVERFRDYCRNKATARTANNKLKVLRSFFQSAWQDELIPDNPAKKVKTLKTEQVIRRGFTLDELSKIMKAADSEWKGMTIVGFYVGPRLKDIALMTGRHVDLPNLTLKFATSKTDRAMNVPIAAPLAKWMAKHLPKAADAPLFPAAYKIVKRTGDTNQLSQQFHDIMVRAHLAEARPSKNKSHGAGRDGPRKKSPITFHSLRHTITSTLKNAGVSEAVTRDIVGHESASVSQEYTHIDHATKRAALDKLPDITA